MTANADKIPLTHFGRQVRKERMAHGWSLREFANITDLAAPYWSQIENGRRPPTLKVAQACDAAFPQRNGYFTEYYEESRTWMPAGFRDWTEHEEKTSTLRDWSPTVVTGLLQTADYARSVLETSLGADDEIITKRLTTRMERQRRLFARELRAWFIIDEPSLSRLAGSPQVMAEQMSHLLDVADQPNITVQVLPAVIHPAGASGFVITDTAAYAEHVIAGYVYTEAETVTRFDILFDTLRAECHRASESAAIIRRAGETWTGEQVPTATPTAGTA